MTRQARINTSNHFVTLTPNDSTALLSIRALYAVSDGNIVAEDIEGNQETFPVTAGQILPIQPSKVLATGTTSTIIALY